MNNKFRLLFSGAIVCIGITATTPVSYADIYVKGYTRKDGTYVAPHHRSNPDGNFQNNWSTKGNVNPYTGETGTKVEGTDNSTIVIKPPTITPQNPKIENNQKLDDIEKKNKELIDSLNKESERINKELLDSIAMDKKELEQRSKEIQEQLDQLAKIGSDYQPPKVQTKTYNASEKVEDISKSTSEKTYAKSNSKNQKNEVEKKDKKPNFLDNFFSACSDFYNKIFK